MCSEGASRLTRFATRDVALGFVRHTHGPGRLTEGAMVRHALGVLGVLAAGVLLAVSCAMNWRFGVSLGRTEFDGQIYGAASAAADCMKALVPFFFFANGRLTVSW